MRRKIRHALVQYTVVKDGKPNFETAFRNQVVDIPEDQVERLDELGATVAPDEALERPGRMSELSETASDAEIMNWVMGASKEETENLVQERPAMASRLLSAADSVRQRFEEQDFHLGGSLSKVADEFEAAIAQADAEALAELEAEAAAAEAEAAAIAAAEADLIGGELSAEQADTIVAGTAKEVSDYIAENPRSAGVLLEAEGRRAANTKENSRVSIVKAAEAAAGFTQ